MAVDWLKIRNEYINGGGSYRKLSEKYGISFSVLKDIAVKEHWAEAKKQHINNIRTKTEQKTVEKISDSESEIAAIKSRLKLDIFRQLEERTNVECLDGMEFRRLVQSFKDMCDIQLETEDSTTLKKARELLGGVDSAIDSETD